MHSFEARTKPDPRSLRSCKQQSSWARALTVWCKHRVSEAPDFFPWRGPTRCKQMAVAFLNMPPRAVGRRPLQGQRREGEPQRRQGDQTGTEQPPLLWVLRRLASSDSHKGQSPQPSQTVISTILIFSVCFLGFFFFR